MRRLVIILILLLVAILAVAGLIVYNLFGFFSSSPEPTVNLVTINKTVVGTNQIYYLLFSIKAYELHNPPLSSNTPKINIEIGNKRYKAEILDKKIQVEQGSLEKPDLKISCKEDEFIKILNSENFNFALQNSVKSGRTNIEILAGKTELFTKGYLNLYREITGKSLLGSFLRV